MDIKETWREMHIESDNHKQYESAMSGRKLTALETLKRSYRRFAILGTVMIFMTLAMALGHHIGNFLGPHRMLFFIVWALYFATCAVMDSWLYFGISRIDINTMTVSEVSKLAMYYRKRHLQFIVILLPWALAIIGWFAFIALNDTYMVLAILIGFIAGLCMGVRKLMEFLNAYKDLKE